MKARRLALGLSAAAVTALLALDLALTLFVLPNPSIVWRPLPPFRALTHAAQRTWLEQQQEELEGARKEHGIGRFDPLLGWSHRPNAQSSSGDVHTNARGLRGTRDYPDERPPGVRRIVACGDSYTFCDEVADDEAWPAVLEGLETGLEVWNAGVGGYGTGQALLRFQTLDTGLVDAVIVGLLLENIGRNVNRYRPRWYPRSFTPVSKPRYALDGMGLRLVPQPYATRDELVRAVQSGAVLEDLREGEYWLDEHLPRFLSWSALARLWAGRRVYQDRELDRLWGDPAGEPFLVTVRLLEAFRLEAEQRGATRFLVLVFPFEPDLAVLVERGERFWQPLLDVLVERDLDHVDVAELLRVSWAEEGPESPPVFRGTHLSAESNRRVAEAVREWLEGS